MTAIGTDSSVHAKLADSILEIVCRGKHKRGGVACQITCGVQVTGIMRLLADALLAKRREVLEEAATFVDVCAEQCAVKARSVCDRSVCEPNYWWPKNQVLTGVAERIRALAQQAAPRDNR